MQGPIRQTSNNSTTCNITLDTAPQEGNMLIACVATSLSTGLSQVDSIVDALSSGSVTWTRQKQVNHAWSSWYNDVEIWLGAVGSGATTSVAITLDHAPDYGCTVDICEYYGVEPFKDSEIDNFGTGTSVSTEYANPPTYSHELLIGACAELDTGFSNPSNDFVLLDAQYQTGQISLGYLEKIATTIDDAYCELSGGNNNWVACLATFKASSPTITKIQDATGVTSYESATCGIVLNNTPQEGNVLIACIAKDTDEDITSISQDYVQWSQVVASEQTNYGYRNCEIWLGIVDSGASVDITINFNGTVENCVVDVCEYSGIDVTTDPTDQTQSNSDVSSTPSTGITDDPTTFPDELWIGAFAGATTISTPTNGFTLFDCTGSNSLYLAYIEKPVTATLDYASCEAAGGTAWAGCIATFRAKEYVDTFKIESTAYGHCQISPSGIVHVEKGAHQDFTTTVDTGYSVASCFVDGSPTTFVNPFPFDDIQADHTIAVSTNVVYTITPNLTHSHIDGSDAIRYVDSGNNLQLSFHADDHYHITDVTVCEQGQSPIDLGVVSSHQFTNVTANWTVTVTSAIDTYTITPSAGTHCTISPSTPQTVDYDGSKLFTFQTDSGYHISNVCLDGTTNLGSRPSYQFEHVTSNRTIDITAAQNPPNLEVMDLTVDGNLVVVGNADFSGYIKSTNNTLDNGSGNMNITGEISTAKGNHIRHVFPYVHVHDNNGTGTNLIQPVLPTETIQSPNPPSNPPVGTHCYWNAENGNIMFEHTGDPDASHHFGPEDSQGNQWGKYANIYMIMMQEVTGQGYPGSIEYQPIIAMDRGLFVEKDIHTYGALMTQSDPVKGTGGGAIMIGHGMFGSNDPPCIVVPDSGYDTLNIYTNLVTKTLGNLALSILYVCGEGVNLLGSAAINIADSAGYILKASLSCDSTNAILYSNADIVLKPTGNVRPFSPGGSQLGTSDIPWSKVYGNYLYENVSGGLGGDTAHHFDWLDDLQYAKNYKIKGDVIDFQASFPFLHKDGCIRLGDVFGYLVGCHKQAAIKLDDQEELAWHLFNGVEAHDNKILALETKIADLQSQINSLKA
jgi:hypothetical protein